MATDWVDEVIAGWSEDALPEVCQQFGCQRPMETYCPLCRCVYCHEHDELYPRRRHDCLRGPAHAEVG